MKKNDSLKLGSIFPYLGSLLIFFGVFRINLYYGIFNIKILSFLDFSEIITSFLDVIIIVVLLSTYALFNIYAINKVVKLQSWKIMFWKSVLSEKRFFYRLKIYFITDVILFKISLAMFLISLLCYFIYKSPTTLIITTLMIIITVIFSIVYFEYINYLYTKNLRRSNSIITNAIISYSIIVILILSLYTILETQLVKHRLKYPFATVIFDDGRIFVSDYNKFYIGNTSKYLFIHDKTLQSTEVYLMEGVKKLRFFSKEKYSYYK